MKKYEKAILNINDSIIANEIVSSELGEYVVCNKGCGFFKGNSFNYRSTDANCALFKVRLPVNAISGDVHACDSCLAIQDKSHKIKTRKYK